MWNRGAKEVSKVHQVQQHKLIFTDNSENLDSSPYLAAWKKPQFLFTDRTALQAKGWP